MRDTHPAYPLVKHHRAISMESTASSLSGASEDELARVEREYGKLGTLAQVAFAYAEHPLPADLESLLENGWTSFLDIETDELCRLIEGAVTVQPGQEMIQTTVRAQGITWRAENSRLEIEMQRDRLVLRPVAGYLLFGPCLPVICRMWARVTAPTNSDFPK